MLPSAAARRSRLFEAWLVALGICALFATMPAVAIAVPGSGGVTVAIGGKGKAAAALAAGDVGVSAVAPAQRRARRVELPVRAIAVSRRSARIALRGGIRLDAGARVLRLRSLRLSLKPRRATISARAGSRRVTVFAVVPDGGKAKLDVDETTAKLARATLVLVPRGASLLRARLSVGSIRAGVLGRLSVTAGPRDSGGPRSRPLAKEPPVKPRPASAVDVSGISIAWYPRDSWVRYLTSGVGPRDGIFASAGATKLPASETTSHPCSDVAYSGSGSFDYGFRFTAKSGWYDPSTGAAAIYGRGAVRFVWEGHTIDVAAANPEIELDGAGSRAIFQFTGKGGTAFSTQRADFIDLDLAGQPTVSGNTRTYSAVRGRLTESGQAVFAGFYPPPNDSFGCMSTSFTTP